MGDRQSKKSSYLERHQIESILEKLPPEAKKWAESLPWMQRRYVLSLCHLMCAATPEMQAEFLDDYTADGLVSRTLQDRETQQRVGEHLKKFNLKTELSETLLRMYIRQFYIHSAQELHRQPDIYLESALRLVISTEQKNNVFNYILGFELLKMMFQMSWLQMERLYQIQTNQDEFIRLYIKPIQNTHILNGIVVPKDPKVFFAKRDYYIQQPDISEKKLVELVIVTFTTDIVSSFGFSIIRHPESLVFDYDYIFRPDPENIFPASM